MQSYLLLIVVSLALGFGTQAYISSSFKKWKEVRNETGLTGYQVSRMMLDAAGLNFVPIVNAGTADMSDYYDPRDNTLYLSKTSFTGTAVSSIAVACHEAGHAVQHARGYAPAKIRSAIVPVVNFGSQSWMIILLMGFLFNASGLVTAGIVLFSFVVIFQLVTLPVEFDASRRAMTSLKQVVALPADQYAGARTVLTAAALTYVAAALTSIMQLLYLVGANRD